MWNTTERLKADKIDERMKNKFTKKMSGECMCKKFCKFRFHKLQTKETPSKLISKLIWMIIPTAQI